MNPTTAAALEETSVDTRFTEAVVGRDSKEILITLSVIV